MSIGSPVVADFPQRRASPTPAGAPRRVGPDCSTDAVPSHALEGRELRHEVGNALAAAQGYAQFLLRRVPAWADESDRRAIQSIADCVARACRLFECPSAASDRPATCDLAALIAAAADQVPPERWADVCLRLPADGPLHVYWEADRLTQVLANLLGNAAKYSPAGTPIEVELEQLGASGWARVVVRDHGIGIDVEALESIFAGKRTERARQMAAGQGLGLQLSRRMVEAQGGLL